MTTLEEWLNHRDEWHDRDLELMTTDAGWRLAKERSGVKIWSQPFPDDPNNLFRWIIPDLQADYRTVYDVFVNRFHDYHQYWTKEYTGGFDVDIIDDSARLSYQQYDSGIPLIANRDWLVVQWTREVRTGLLQVGFRTIVSDKLGPVNGYVRIDWWGAHLFEDNGDGTSKLYFLDRENQGGNFPSFLMNRMMPKYLIYQYEAIGKFFRNGGTDTHTALPKEKNSAHVLGLF